MRPVPVADAVWGKRRRSGISWWLYGPELATRVAAARGRPLHGGMTGTLDEGWARLEQMIAGGEESVPEDYIEEMQTWAANFPLPTLVIAFCDVEAPR